MRVLRLKLFQETACYKKPYALKVSETYPLPPFSTVKGMIHALLGAEKLIPMKFCIQGKYETMFADYQTHYFFKKNNTDEFPLNLRGLENELKGMEDLNYKEITTMPIYRHLLYGVELYIYVLAEERVLQDICEAFNKNTSQLSLGRAEDLVRIDDCGIVELEALNGSARLTWNAYVPKKYFNPDDVKHVPYRINSVYRVVENVRIWDKIAVGYIESGTTLRNKSATFYKDALNSELDNVVFFYD